MSLMPPICVSALVSTFNAERFLVGCIQDLEDQTIAERLEIVVIDSGSEQNEKVIVREFQQHYDNIRYVRTENREPLYAAWNRGIRLARGRYLTNANTDDRHRRDAFERMAAVLDMRPDVALVYGDVIKTEIENEVYDHCTPSGRYRWYDWDRYLLLTRGCFIGPQPMWRKSVHDRYGYFDERLVTSGDYEFWLRISQTLNFYHIREPLGLYLVGPASIEHRHKELKQAEDLQIMTDYHRAASKGEIIRAVAKDLRDGGRPILEKTSWYQQYRNTFCQNRTNPFSPAPAGRLNTGGNDMLPVEQMYEDMQPVLQGSRPEDVMRALQNLVRSFPEFARAHNDLGTLYYHSGEKQKALGHFERAATIAPENPLFLKNLADYYHVEMARAEDAVKIYCEIVALRPNDVQILLTAAHLLVGLRRFEEAAAHYRRALDIEPWNAEAKENLQKILKVQAGAKAGPSPEEMHAEVQRLISQGNASAARLQLEKLLKVHPGFALAHNDLGVLCFQAGDKDRALRHYEEAARLQPENHTFQKNLADFYYIEQGRIEEALRIYVGILKARPEDIETLLATGHICVTLSRLEDAKTFYERVREIEPWNTEALRQLDRLSDRTAGQGFPQLRATAADEYAEASRLIEGGNIPAGRARLMQIVAEHPDYALAHNDLGVLAYQAGDKQAALTYYQKAVGLQPGNTAFQKNLADCYWIGFGQVEDALKIYVDILKAQPEDIEPLLATGKLCLALRQPDDARVFFDRVLEIEPWNTDAHQQLEQLELASKAA